MPESRCINFSSEFRPIGLPILIVIIIGGLAAGGVIGASIYAVVSYRRALARRRADRLIPRSFSYSPSTGLNTPGLDSSVKENPSKQNTPRLPLGTLGASPGRKANNLLPKINNDQPPTRQDHQEREIQGDENENTDAHMEELSRQTTEYSVTSTIVAEAGSRPTTPRTPTTPRRRSVSSRFPEKSNDIA